MARRQFVVYSAELYDQTGSGVLKITIPQDADKETFIAHTRATQKELNAQYREEHPTTRKARNHAEAAAAIRSTSVSTTSPATPAERPAPSLSNGIKAHATVELKLDPGTGNSTVLLGSSKAGKSTAMMQLYEKYYARKDQISVLFAENAQIPLYNTGADRKRLIAADCFEPGLVKMAQFIQKQTGNHYKFCFMLDDILDRRDDVTLRKLVLSFRNSDISSIVSLQYSNLLAKNSRANVNNIMLFRFNSQEAIEIAINQFLKAHFRRLGIAADDMVDFYKEATADHGFLYVHPATDTLTFHRLKL